MLLGLSSLLSNTRWLSSSRRLLSEEQVVLNTVVILGREDAVCIQGGVA